MEEAGGRECEGSRVEDRVSCRSNEMEGRCASNRGGDEVYPATFGNEEETRLKLDDDDEFMIKSFPLKSSEANNLPAAVVEFNETIANRACNSC